ncbi:MAG: dTDP-4-dehydrorhamnose reductase [Deltaproteobacteria bacterium]|nr:dTDP-4-dehydrorhamnose reductase [Deltaproteobacteria bacterium]
MPQSSPSILLTGVTGQVGGELYNCLQHLGKVVPTVARGERFGAQALEMDLTDPDSIRQVCAAVRPSLIVSPAAYTAVDKAEQDEATAFAVNAKAPEILAACAKQYGAAMVHYSTDYVYPGVGTEPHTELSPVGPINVYGKSKLAGDEAIVASGVPHLILRTSWVFGIHGHNFVKTMLKLGSERETLKIISDQIGSPTSARTLADITAMMLASVRSRKHGFAPLADRGGIYHVTNSGFASWYEFAIEIFRIARLQGTELKVKDVDAIATEAYPTPARRPKNSRLSLAKLADNYGIMPATWQEALALMMKR